MEAEEGERDSFTKAMSEGNSSAESSANGSAAAGAAITELAQSQELSDACRSALERVTSVKVEHDSREQRRAADTEKKKKELREKKDQERAESAAASEVILQEWLSLTKGSVPQELVEEIKRVQGECDAVLASKERLIKEHQNYVKIKEDEYAKALSKQAEDVDDILKIMHEEYKALDETLGKNLDLIEGAFDDELRALRRHHKSEIESLFEDRRAQEMKFLEMRQEANEEARKQIDDLRVLEAEEYTILKIKLETEIQTLEQHLQEMKSTYLLNNEKLTHNFRLLGERDFEHTQLIQQQKKKINRLQDTLSTLKAKYAQTDKRYRHRNMELTDEYKRITSQYKDLQTKFRHFQKMDEKRFAEVWDMNVQRAEEVVSKLLRVDRLIAENEVGLKWFKPTGDYLKLNIDTKPNDTIKERRFSPKISKASVIFDPKYKKIVDLICDEAGFLIEPEVHKLFDMVDKDEQNRMKINSILYALGVDSDDLAETLLGYFITVSDEEGEEDIESDIITREKALEALKSFLEENRREPHEAVNLELEAIIASEEEKKERQRREQEREFWVRLSEVVPNKTMQLWKVLEKEMSRYHEVLNERAKLLEDTDNIRTQNEELKGLLNQYLHSKLNEELVIPPIKFT